MKKKAGKRRKERKSAFCSRTRNYADAGDTVIASRHVNRYRGPGLFTISRRKILKARISARGGGETAAAAIPYGLRASAR